MVSRSFFFCSPTQAASSPIWKPTACWSHKTRTPPRTHRKAAPANRTSDPPQNRKIKHDIRTEMVILHSSLLSYPLQEVYCTEGVHFDLYLFLIVYALIISAFMTCKFMHVIHTKHKKQANSIRNQIKELTLGRIRNNVCLCNIAK